MQQPHIILNWGAIVLSIVLAFMFGGVWYGPLFGKTWAKAIGMDCEKKPPKEVMMRAMGLQVLGTFLITFCLTHDLQAWRPSAWGITSGDGSDAVMGFFGGFFTWLGFFVPLQLNKVGWEGRPWKVFFINAGHDFVNLQIISQVLSHWR
jgi:hypothetical protein